MTSEWVVNHVWQSTWFALVAAALAWALRKNSAKVRYGVWLGASLKFLVPFALLVSLGSVVPRPARQVAPAAAPVFSSTVVEIAEPFFPGPGAAVPSHGLPGWMPVAIGIVWALGFVAIVAARFASWLRIRATLRAGTEIELPIPVRALVAPQVEEPGVVGLLRPVLLLPARLLGDLSPRQLQAVLAHELSHVRRRDNLFAAVHMLVEAIFWFHPLAWWIGSKLVEERELACDEEVLRMGCEPADYVEGILKVCRFCKESALPCVAGVTGADVKKRVRAILKGELAPELNFGKKAALAVIGLAVVAAPIAVGVLNAPQLDAQPLAAAGKLEFEAASVRMVTERPKGPVNTLAEFNFGPMNEMEDAINAARRAANITEPRDPNRVVLTDVPMSMIVQLAFGTLNHSSVHLEAPEWVDDHNLIYTVEAITPKGTTRAQAQEMVRALLIDRFGMKFHTEARPGEVYEISRDGRRPLRLKESAGPATIAAPGFTTGPGADGMPTFPPGTSRIFILPTHARLQAVNLPMREVVKFLGSALNAEVVDATGLTGKYSLQLDFDPELNRTPPPNVEPAPPLSEELGRLGLALTKKKGVVQVTVIDALNQIPSGN